MKRKTLLSAIVIMITLNSFDYYRPETIKSFLLKGNVKSIVTKYFNIEKRDSLYYKMEKQIFDNKNICMYKKVYNYNYYAPNYTEKYLYDNKNKLLCKYYYEYENELKYIIINKYNNDKLTESIVMNNDSSEIYNTYVYEYYDSMIVKKDYYGEIGKEEDINKHPNLDTLFFYSNSSKNNFYYWSQDIEKYKLKKRIVFDKDERYIENYIVDRPDFLSVTFLTTNNETGKTEYGSCDSWYRYYRNDNGAIVGIVQFDEESTIPCINSSYILDKYDNPIKINIINILNQESEIHYQYEYDKFNNWIRREELKDGKVVETIIREIDYYL